MKHWNYEVWHWKGRWLRGTVAASNTQTAVRRALETVPEYTKKLPRKGVQVIVKVTRID